MKRSSRPLPRARIWLGLLLVLLGLRVVLPALLKVAVNARLRDMPGYTGEVQDIDVALWRGAYQLEGLRIMKANGAVEQPFLEVGVIDFSLSWRHLLRGRILSDILFEDARLTFTQAKTAAETQTPTDGRWQDVIEDLFPIEITRLEIVRSEVRLLNEREGDVPYDIRLQEVQLMATGLRNRAESGDELPAQVELTATTDAEGSLRLRAQGAPLAEEPRFDLDAELRGVDLPQLNDFLRAYAGVDVSEGTLSVFMEVAAADGRFEGYLKPFLEHLDFSDYETQQKPLLSKLWEGVVSLLATVFKNHRRDQLGTRVTFGGELGRTDVATLSSVFGIVRHAFIQAFSERLDDSIDRESLPRDQASDEDADKSAAEAKR